ncbi:hypothetical protein SDC9_140400 [bioreactor metagenome]|uniref:Uncharacterized protein n=1 Tax=bioreactor metagenome TaxID=1076179 RepID=A0A645DUS2_9ZZZZ
METRVIKPIILVRFEDPLPVFHVTGRVSGKRKMDAVEVSAQENRFPVYQYLGTVMAYLVITKFGFMVIG